MQKTTYKATMWLPSGGKQYWSTIMSGEATLPPDLYQGDIIVAAYACFDDGTQVIGGVKKWDSEASTLNFLLCWMPPARRTQAIRWIVPTMKIFYTQGIFLI